MAQEAGNIWFKINAVGKLPGLLGTAYWLGLLLDAVISLDVKYFGLSTPGLAFGLVVSTFSTLSAIRVEYIINSVNDRESLLPVTTDSQLLEQPVQADHTVGCSGYTLLAGFCIDQTADKASACGLLAHILFTNAGIPIIRILTQLGMVAFGLITSVAEVKTGYANLKRF